MSITVPDILDMFSTSSSQAYTVIDVTFSLPIFFLITSEFSKVIQLILALLRNVLDC